MALKHSLTSFDMQVVFTRFTFGSIDFFFYCHFCNVIRTLCFRLTGFLWFTVLSVSVAFDRCFLRQVLQMKAHDIFFPV